MVTNYLDIAIIVCFLAATIISAVKNIGDIKGINGFALGGREFTTGALAATIIATWVSGSGFLITLNETYFNGLYYIIPSLGMALSMVIVAVFIVPRMEFFLGRTSVAGAMGEIYGPTVRKITAFCGAVGVSGMIAVQFKVFGNLGNALFGINSRWLTVGIGALIIWYSRLGGVRSVVKTDIIQMLSFLIALPVVGIMIFRTFYAAPEVDLSLIDKFNFKHVFTTYDAKFLDMVLLGLYFAMPSMNPAAVQRVSMGWDIDQVKKAWLYAALIVLIIKLCSSLLPIFLYTINPHLKEGEILSYLINNFSITGIKGLLIVGIISMAMSTADSYLNISAVLIANDLWKADELDDADKMVNARTFTVWIGLIAIVLAVKKTSLLSIILLTNSFYMPVVTIPLLFALFGYRGNEKCVLISMWLTIAFVLFFHLVSYFNLFKTVDPIIPGMVVNAIGLLITDRFIKEKKDLTQVEIVEVEPKPTVRKHTKAKKKTKATKGLKKARS